MCNCKVLETRVEEGRMARRPLSQDCSFSLFPPFVMHWGPSICDVRKIFQFIAPPPFHVYTQPPLLAFSLRLPHPSREVINGCSPGHLLWLTLRRPRCCGQDRWRDYLHSSPFSSVSLTLSFSVLA